MNVRARLLDVDEFYYPTSDSPADMAEFWTVLEGYRLKGKAFELNWGSTVEDKKGIEVYSKDVVTIYFQSGKRIKSPNDIETGVVEFIDGCFVIMNPAGLIWDLGSTFMEDETFALKIVGSFYDTETIINE